MDNMTINNIQFRLQPLPVDCQAWELHMQYGSPGDKGHDYVSHTVGITHKMALHILSNFADNSVRSVSMRHGSMTPYFICSDDDFTKMGIKRDELIELINEYSPYFIDCLLPNIITALNDGVHDHDTYDLFHQEMATDMTKFATEHLKKKFLEKETAASDDLLTSLLKAAGEDEDPDTYH